MPIALANIAVLVVLAGLSACQCGRYSSDTEETGPGHSAPIDSGDSFLGDTAHSGETGDTQLPPMLELICNDDYLDPVALPEAMIDPDEPTQAYRVVQVESEHFDEAYLLVVFHTDPEERLYDAGAPVVVGAIPALLLQEEPVAQLLPGFGVIEIQPIFSGWSVDGVGTSGDPDAGGPADADMLREAILFGAGRKTTIEGYTLGQVVEAPVCNDKVMVLGASSGAIVAMMALASMDEELASATMGFANHEAPLLPQLLLGDAGALWMDPQDPNNLRDQDGDGYTFDEGINPTYRPGDCQGTSCDLDYSALLWDPVMHSADINTGRFEGSDYPGVLYLDLDGDGQVTHIGGSLDVNQNGWLDADEDFMFMPHWDKLLPDGAHMYSPEVLGAAVTSGILREDNWPEHVASLAETVEFWQVRNMMNYVEPLAAVAPPWFRAAIDYTEVDHGQALPDRPHVMLFYDAFDAAGVPIRYNYSEAMMDCTVAPGLWKAAWTGQELPYNYDLQLSELDDHAMVEDVPNSIVRALPAVGLLWDMYGEFDRCPLIAED